MAKRQRVLILLTIFLLFTPVVQAKMHPEPSTKVPDVCPADFACGNVGSAYVEANEETTVTCEGTVSYDTDLTEIAAFYDRKLAWGLFQESVAVEYVDVESAGRFTYACDISTKITVYGTGNALRVVRLQHITSGTQSTGATQRSVGGVDPEQETEGMCKYSGVPYLDDWCGFTVEKTIRSAETGKGLFHPKAKDATLRAPPAKVKICYDDSARAVNEFSGNLRVVTYFDDATTVDIVGCVTSAIAYDLSEPNVDMLHDLIDDGV